MVDPVMSEDLIDTWSLAWIVVENLCDNVSCSLGDWHIFREIVRVHTDSLVCSFDV